MHEPQQQTHSVPHISTSVGVCVRESVPRQRQRTSGIVALRYHRETTAACRLLVKDSDRHQRQTEILI